MGERGEPLRVAILGGGMAGLAAAWRLTRPDGPRPDVTIYQRGFRLGGKGASSRGINGRIEEHGLHVWPGYYENAFALMRACYQELDRPRHDPSCPIQGWRDAFFPAGVIGLGEESADGWAPWVAAFPENAEVPGAPPRGRPEAVLMNPAEMVPRAFALLNSLAASLESRHVLPRAVLAMTSRPPTAVSHTPDPRALMRLLADPAAAPRMAQLVELLSSMARGAVADRVVSRGYSSIDHMDFREWLRRHGASPAALESPLVRGMYDLVFGYERGDRLRPRFAAGLGLHLAARMFFTYRGAIFWKMRAGMGDVVFAPLYQVLARRGVRFRFFHRLDALRLSADGRSVAAISLGRQATLAAGRDGYEPLVRVRGLPVFPGRPDAAQLRAAPEIAGHDLESHSCPWPDAGTATLEAGRDFDHAVLAVSLGMIPLVAGELLERDPRWRSMTEGVGTVATQSLQLWLNEDERSLGWRERGAVVTGCGDPFDTFASMSHTLPFEGWDESGDDPLPSTAASFCAVLPDDEAVRGRDAVATNAERFLNERAGRLWPNSVGREGFRWELLVGGGRTREETAATRLDSQYLRANTDPSDRYVQALPGTGQFRLRADGSGLDNLALAGDWIDSGLNAGCIEAAVLAGFQAANAIEGRPIDEGTVGFRPVGTGAR